MFELAVLRVVGFKIKVSSDDGSEICPFSLRFLYFLDEHADLIEPSFLILLQGGNMTWFRSPHAVPFPDPQLR